MFRLALKQAMFERSRFWLGVAGISAAIALVVAMQAMFAGLNSQVTRYIDRSGVDLVVLQDGVTNFFLTTSTLPAGTLERVRGVDGVSSAVPLLMAAVPIKLGQDTLNDWLVGIPANAPFGGPWSVKGGDETPTGDKVVMDAARLKKYGLSLGNNVEIAGQTLSVGGLSSETDRLGTTMTFMDLDRARILLAQTQDQTSYVLVRVERGVSVDQVASEIRRVAGRVTVLPAGELAQNDIRLSQDMGGAALQMMKTIALMIGLMAISVTMFAAVSERIRDYAVMKAMGAGGYALFRMILLQAVTMAALGVLVGIILVAAVAPVVSRSTSVLLVLHPAEVLLNIPLGVLVGVVAVLLPWAKVARADAMTVFQQAAP